jgi:hypothetical protein
MHSVQEQDLTKTITAAEYRAHQARSRSKYSNVADVEDGITFDSKREANCYRQLRDDEDRGRIRNLKLQYVFPIVIDGVRVCDYVADFVFEEKRGDAWRRVVADAKGHKTEVYRLKKKLMRAVHGITVREL